MPGGWCLLLAAALLLSLLAALPSVAALDLPLQVRNDQPLARTAEPVASGIPLKRGAVMNPADLRVYGPAGKQVPCQAHQLGLSWPDGSLRWVLLQFPATVAANQTATYRVRAQPLVPAVAPPDKLVCRETPDLCQITTGPARLTVSRQDFRLPGTIEYRAGARAPFGPAVTPGALTLVADREHMTAEEFKATGRDAKDAWQYGLDDTGEIKWGKVQPGIDYSAQLRGPVTTTFEEKGPFRAVLRVERAAAKSEGELGFVARIYAYAGKPYFRVEYTLESYEQFILVTGINGYQQALVNNKHLRDFTLRLALPNAAQAVEFGGPAGPLAADPAQSPALRQLAPHSFTLTRGAAPAKPEHAPGWVTATAGSQRVTLATKWFWETAPRGLAYDAAGKALDLELQPRSAPAPGYPLAAGRVKTYEFAVGVNTPGPQLSALTRAELHAYPDPDYVANSGATHRFVSLADKRFPAFARYVAETRKQDQAVRLYGDVDFGDQIGWNDKERWNGYHGTEHEWWTYYLESGEPELFRIAEANTWHSIDLDTQHWGFQPGCHEAEYARKHDHVCAAYYQGGIKVWVLGEMDYYYLTGRRRVLESLGRSTEFLLNCGGIVNKSYTTERGTSLPFLHLAHLYGVLGDEGALTKAFPQAMKAGAGKFRTDSKGPAFSVPFLAALQDVCAHFNRVYDKGEHTKCSFLSSYPGEALYEYHRLTGDPAGAAGVVKAAKFLYQDSIMPTGIIQYAGGKPWDDNSPWMPWWDGVDAPAALAYLVTGDKQYLDWGKAPVDWILNYRRHAYSSGLWSWQGALGFGGTLGTYLWALGQAGMTEADVAKMRPDLDYEAGLKAEIAKCEEFREKAMQNTGESGTFCRLAGEVGRVMINQGKLDEAITWLEPWSKAPYGTFPQWMLRRAKELKGQQ